MKERAWAVVTVLVLCSGLTAAIWPVARASSVPASARAGTPLRRIAGWRVVSVDRFASPKMSTDRRWRLYFGQPGGDPAGFWDPSHDVISHHELQLRAYRSDRDVRYGERPGTWVSGGLSNRIAQKYGKYLVRVRISDGVGIGGVLLLWPADGSWPPEVDFSEDGGASPRDRTFATLHYGARNAIIQHSIGVNLTHWHTLGVEWLPGHLTYTLDGRPWARVVSPEVPDIPMRLDMQLQQERCGGGFNTCPDARTPSLVTMDVAWVAIYRPSRRTLLRAEH